MNCSFYETSELLSVFGVLNYFNSETGMGMLCVSKDKEKIVV